MEEGWRDCIISFCATVIKIFYKSEGSGGKGSLFLCLPEAVDCKTVVISKLQTCHYFVRFALFSFASHCS